MIIFTYGLVISNIFLLGEEVLLELAQKFHKEKSEKINKGKGKLF